VERRLLVALLALTFVTGIVDLAFLTGAVVGGGGFCALAAWSVAASTE